MEDTIKVQLNTPLRGYPVYVGIPSSHGADAIRMGREICNEILAGLVNDEMARREDGLQAVIRIAQPVIDNLLQVPHLTPEILREISKEDADRLLNQHRGAYLAEEFSPFLEAMMDLAAKKFTEKGLWGKLGEMEFQFDLIVQPKGTNTRFPVED